MLTVLASRLFQECSMGRITFLQTTLLQDFKGSNLNCDFQPLSGISGTHQFQEYVPFPGIILITNTFVNAQFFSLSVCFYIPFSFLLISTYKDVHVHPHANLKHSKSK